MKNPAEIITQIFKPLAEFFSFAMFVIAGSVYKMRKLHEKGTKITFKRFLIEAFMSLFIAGIAYAFIDQFLHFNKLFSYAFCSLAGSMSDLIYSKLEELAITAFDTVRKQIKKIN
ncbi:hypothetical protein [Flavobacterium sp. AG291]|uniref:hypothetical protein n=1 Tax=Flavobacterium sp. AG291 TaxID=2184000 RepID=UPI000E0B5185|nr:hypothetical protein [Flavobacterium sp. AG291]RDI07039.1 hypothetical protein DEU42_113139 [Flavobacterium sp. AG291]